MNFVLKHFSQTTNEIDHVTKDIQDSDRFRAFINRFIYFVGGFGVAVIVPQATRIWIGEEVDGVSLTTWGGFFLASIFWLLYGIVHREKPIIYTNTAVCFLDFVIITGILFHRI